VFGGAAVIYYRYQQDKLQNTIRVETIGTPLLGLGGDFSLVSHDGKAVTSDSLKGGYVLLYFGFTFCPDICPTEIKKMEEALRIYCQFGNAG
jgi:cytochrome oxidase Cu insertion factor (SCO1/SenC/PrrC family)